MSKTIEMEIEVNPMDKTETLRSALSNRINFALAYHGVRLERGRYKVTIQKLPRNT